MRIACWASLLLPLLALPAWASAGAAADTLRAETAAGGKTRLHLVAPGGKPVTLLVPRDDQVPARAPVEQARVVAVVGDTVVLTDRYRSRLNQGQGQCGAGVESFVRVVQLAPARQVFQVKLESCWNDVEPDHEPPAQGVEWNAESGELRLKWLQGPAGQGPETLRLKVGPGGRVEPVKPA